jgi:hypothetical protein
MLRKLIMGAGMAYMARRFMGGRRGMAPGMSRGGLGFGRRNSGF